MLLTAPASPHGGDAPPRHSAVSRTPRFRRTVLTALAATGITVALAAPAVAAPVGVPVPPGGQVAAWGANESGQTAVPAPPAGQTYTAVAAGEGHSLALTSAGQVIAWGNNENGQTNVPAPPVGQTYTAVAAGGEHSIALTSAGGVIAWEIPIRPPCRSRRPGRPTPRSPPVTTILSR
ncbi:hypothetical protein GS909_23225 [Rhodococcus hoagii]|nr:hypothetical protein [Prescottella equi]